MRLPSTPIMHFNNLVDERPSQAPERSRWIAAAVMALVVGWLTYWYRDTAISIESIWRRSETFAHGYAIVPIVLYLVWRSRGHLARQPIAPSAIALPFIVGAGFAWLIARAASVLGGEQFMFVLMIPLAVWAVLGTLMFRALAFPLVFLLFAVPFGEFAVPKLMDWTADFTVIALSASGVPVFREGNSFIIPSGRWSVVEACSGVRYLIASLVVGSLYAYLTYRSWQRRLVFIAAAIVVPLVANWVRAYTIVMIGHLSNNRLAVGVDHVIYGWVFFGVVMALLFGVASIWREDMVRDSPPATDAAGALPAANPVTLVLMGLAVVVASGPWPPLSASLDASDAARQVRLGAIAPIGGWAVTKSTDVQFRPDFANPLAETTQYFAKGDVRVGVFVGYYAAQNQARELVSHHNQIATTTNRHWREIRRGRVEASVGGSALSVRAAELEGAAVRLDAWRWYWIDGRLTASDVMAKVLLAWSRLTGRGDDSAVVVIYGENKRGNGDADSGLRQFASEMGGSITRMLDAAEGR
jgi:exosortase A